MYIIFIYLQTLFLKDIMSNANTTGNIQYRGALALAGVSALLLFWVTGAVGIIGNEGNPANLLYFGVLAIGIAGALVSRLKPRGMTRVLFVMAIAQMLVPVIALAAWRSEIDSWGAAGVGGVFLLNAGFALLFAGSAWLFHKAWNGSPDMISGSAKS